MVPAFQLPATFTHSQHPTLSWHCSIPAHPHHPYTYMPLLYLPPSGNNDRASGGGKWTSGKAPRKKKGLGIKNSWARQNIVSCCREEEEKKYSIEGRSITLVRGQNSGWRMYETCVALSISSWEETRSAILSVSYSRKRRRNDSLGEEEEGQRICSKKAGTMGQLAAK